MALVRPTFYTFDARAISYRRYLDLFMFLFCDHTHDAGISYACLLLTLSAGLSGLSNYLTEAQTFQYEDIPGFPEPGVAVRDCEVKCAMQIANRYALGWMGPFDWFFRL